MTLLDKSREFHVPYQHLVPSLVYSYSNEGSEERSILETRFFFLNFSLCLVLISLFYFFPRFLAYALAVLSNTISHMSPGLTQMREGDSHTPTGVVKVFRQDQR